MLYPFKTVVASAAMLEVSVCCFSTISAAPQTLPMCFPSGVYTDEIGTPVSFRAEYAAAKERKRYEVEEN